MQTIHLDTNPTPDSVLKWRAEMERPARSVNPAGLVVRSEATKAEYCACWKEVNADDQRGTYKGAGGIEPELWGGECAADFL